MTMVVAVDVAVRMLMLLIMAMNNDEDFEVSLQCVLLYLVSNLCVFFELGCPTRT